MTRFKKFVSVILCVALLLSALFTEFTFNVSAATIKIAYIDGTGVGVWKKASNDTNESTLLDRISDRSVTVIGTTIGKDGNSWIKVKYIGNENDDNSAATYGKEVTGYIRNASKDTWVRVVEYDFDLDFETQLEKFPESYRAALIELHEKFPNWRFIPDPVNMTFTKAVSLQDVGMRKQTDYSDLSWRSMRTGSYSWADKKWISTNGGWYGASREAIAYYMDPRNFLNEDEIYMFMSQSYDMGVYTEAGLKKIVAGTFLEKKYTDSNDTEYGGSYIKVIMEAAKQSGVSPYILASKIIQEQGSGGTSSLISGSYNTTYKGYYNFFNFKAYGDTSAEVITNGLKYAKQRGWNSRSASIIGGAKEFALGYIENGQDTYFYQDFNIQFPEKGINHQYAQAVHDARSKGYSLRKTYNSDTQADLTFKIPVYTKIPETLAKKPARNSNLNNYYFEDIKVSGLTPSFDMFTYKYDLKVTGDTIVDADFPSKATMVSDSEFTLKKGNNKVVLTVKSQSGYTTDYVITVNAAKACKLYVNKDPNDSDENPLPDSEPVIKKGDVNDDGKITVSDMANIRLHLLNKYTLVGNAVKAADINNDGKITVSDMANVRLHLLGKYTIK